MFIGKEYMADYISTLNRARGNIITRKMYPKTEVTLNRALQFINTSGRLYSCSAGSSLITVDEFGNVMPCRRLPIVCGNALESTLSDIYFNSDTMRQLRCAIIPTECNGCKYADACRGGARCQSYARYGDFSHADPSCFLIK
jgi:radical SAM protein with 4Fe4S-binding SPASM domain